MYKAFGYLILLLCCLNTIAFWLLAKDDLSIVLSQPLLAISQILSLLGLVLMSLALLFSTRMSILEDVFGGLDSDYVLHHIIGGIAFLFLLNHPLFLVVHNLPFYKLSLFYILPSGDLAYNLGIAALYTMIVSFVFIGFIKISYNAWLWSHRLLVISFLLGGLHTMYISSDVSHNLLLRLWTYLFMAIGTFSSIYVLFLYKKFGPRYKYSVETIVRSSDVYSIYLKPVDKQIRFIPGQFIYMRFDNPKIGNEMHPFSFSSAPWEEGIRVSAKILGDYTKRLSELREGDISHVFGPYGRFGTAFMEGKHNLLFIGGGIGITPFLSMLRYESVYPKGRKIVILYSYKTREEAVFNDEIQALVAYIPNVTFIPWPSHEKGRLSGDHVWKSVGTLQGYRILMCGPQPMMMSLQKQFITHGVDEGSIIFEDFNVL
jgi:predicted ferric reductase